MSYPQSPFFKYPEIQSQLILWNNRYGSADISSSYLQWLCNTPKCTTYRVNLLKSNRDNVRQKIEEELELKYPDKIILEPEILIDNDFPELLAFKNFRMVNNQIEYDLNEVIVDEKCGAALLRGAHLYGPGVLAMQSGTQLGDKINVFADLKGMCKKGTKCHYESDMKIFIGTGIVRMQRHQLFGPSNLISPKGIAIEMLETVSGVPCLGDLSSDCALLQNFPSMVCSQVLDPQQYDKILDMCAAPGNKTTHIAEIIKDTGMIIALDKSLSKINLIQEKIDKYQYKSIHPFIFDSTKALAVDDLIHNTQSIDILLNGPPFPPESFHRILLDAPCSALGNRPVLSINLTGKMLKSYPVLQKKLFTAAVGLLKVNGVLVYSTCTITVAENEGIVYWAKSNFPNLRLILVSPMVYGGEGLADCGLSDIERKLVRRFGPDNRSEIDSVGFFIAKFVKCS